MADNRDGGFDAVRTYNEANRTGNTNRTSNTESRDSDDDRCNCDLVGSLLSIDLPNEYFMIPEDITWPVPVDSPVWEEDLVKKYEQGIKKLDTFVLHMAAEVADFVGSGEPEEDVLDVLEESKEHTEHCRNIILAMKYFLAKHAEQKQQKQQEQHKDQATQAVQKLQKLQKMIQKIQKDHKDQKDQKEQRELYHAGEYS